ncbi:MAG: hypothetical protein RUMPE_00359 [Eubacteriales bacterium SKADARSKE-1]|nr:hypothetical protein [Eubacteriales bacterium SKADARSKE-1]
MYFKAIRYFAYFLEITVFYVIEQTPNLIPNINGIKPTLLIPILFMIALFEGEKIGLIFGLFIGILLDISTSWSIGFFAIMISVCGYIIGLISRRVVKSNLSTAMIISAIFIFFIYSFHFLFCYLINGCGDNLYTFTFHYVPRMVYTLLISLLMYFFNRTLALNIRKEKEKEKKTKQ